LWLSFINVLSYWLYWSYVTVKMCGYFQITDETLLRNRDYLKRFYANPLNRIHCLISCLCVWGRVPYIPVYVDNIVTFTFFSCERARTPLSPDISTLLRVLAVGPPRHCLKVGT
jgi:hypothetical protein